MTYATTQPGRCLGRLSGIDETALIDEGFDRFFRGEHGRALALAYSLSGNRAAAEDLTQDAFLAVHRQWNEIDDPGAYLRRTLANLAASRFRRLGSEARTVARLQRRRDEFAELEPEDAEFWHAVRALPARQRAVVALFYVEDRAVSDIAAILEIAPGTVKSTLHDARAGLARALGLTVTEEPQ